MQAAVRIDSALDSSQPKNFQRQYLATTSHLQVATHQKQKMHMYDYIFPRPIICAFAPLRTLLCFPLPPDSLRHQAQSIRSRRSHACPTAAGLAPERTCPYQQTDTTQSFDIETLHVVPSAMDMPDDSWNGGFEIGQHLGVIVRDIGYFDGT